MLHVRDLSNFLHIAILLVESNKIVKEQKMALLKSAWEIALEKTADIEADPEKIRNEMLFNDARRIVGSFLSDLENDGKKAEEAYNEVSGEKKEIFKKAFASTVLLNIALPQSNDYEIRIKKLIQIAKIIDGPEADSAQLLAQVGAFMDKYLEARDALLERAKEQYHPMWEQKQQQLAQQYGRAPNTPLDQDPDFLKLLQKSYTQLSDQYQEVLEQAKGQLKSAWGIED
jgi:phosphoglycolate phosphatase-like HAD superfamily hydrolase